MIELVEAGSQWLHSEGVPGPSELQATAGQALLCVRKYTEQNKKTRGKLPKLFTEPKSYIQGQTDLIEAKTTLPY